MCFSSLNLRGFGREGFVTLFKQPWSGTPMTRNNMNGKFSVVNQQLFQTYLSWPTQTLWWCYCHHKTCRTVTLLLMERSNICRITSWYGKYLIMFHRLVIDVSWWFGGFPFTIKSMFLQPFWVHTAFFWRPMFLFSDVTFNGWPTAIWHNRLVTFFHEPRGCLDRLDSQCWGLLSSKMWKASLQ